MSSLLSEKKMKKALSLSEEDFVLQFVVHTPISQIKINKERKTFYDIFKSYNFKKYSEIIKDNLKIEDFSKLIKNDEMLKLFCSEVEINFFVRYLEYRYYYSVWKVTKLYSYK